ncbi:hypothetical protein DICVIV_10287 [Dictyocaulus viviparus]|uniref:Uncharacterized protein n=1 Tax=Dictyocaulus viviparus TaxID=29172 RepID=A0A0D8XGI0_DICVI|nr:hypothetical protein DICVIV_10287 [Dictyocaulus viviparus]
MLSYITHVTISALLHTLGIAFGYFMWNVFPKNPMRNITTLPNEISLLIENGDEQFQSGPLDHYTARERITSSNRYSG